MNWRTFAICVLSGLLAGVGGATWWVLRSIGRAIEQINP